jgi:hypothetical protein
MERRRSGLAIGEGTFPEPAYGTEGTGKHRNPHHSPEEHAMSLQAELRALQADFLGQVPAEIAAAMTQADLDLSAYIELRALQKALPDFTALGASLVAVSPQTPDQSLSTAEKNDLTFAVHSDTARRPQRRMASHSISPRSCAQSTQRSAKLCLTAMATTAGSCHSLPPI